MISADTSVMSVEGREEIRLSTLTTNDLTRIISLYPYTSFRTKNIRKFIFNHADMIEDINGDIDRKLAKHIALALKSMTADGSLKMIREKDQRYSKAVYLKKL